MKLISPSLSLCLYLCHSLPLLRDSLVLTKSGPAEFRFRLAGVQLSDRGYYWCDITAWTKQQPGQTWTKATSAESNKVRIDFQENGSVVMCSFVHTTSVATPKVLKCFITLSKMKTLVYHIFGKSSDISPEPTELLIRVPENSDCTFA